MKRKTGKYHNISRKTNGGGKPPPYTVEFGFSLIYRAIRESPPTVKNTVHFYSDMLKYCIIQKRRMIENGFKKASQTNL